MTHPGLALPVNVGHRGASADAPENTLAAFEMAVRQGARMLELDVRLSLDGYPVVIHDTELDRTTDGHGRVEETDLATLRALDIGSWFGGQFAGQRMLTLQEAIEFARTHGIGLDIEMKFNRGPWYPLCDAVGAVIERLDFTEGFVSSFHHRALHYFKTRFPRQAIARLYSTRAPRERNLTFDPHPSVAVLRHLVVPSLVRRVHRLGGSIYVWTVDDPNEMRRLIRMRADAIITNRPAVLQSVLDAWAAHPEEPLEDDEVEEVS